MITAAVQAILGVIMAFGVHLTADETGAILAVTTALLALITALLALITAFSARPFAVSALTGFVSSSRGAPGARTLNQRIKSSLVRRSGLSSWANVSGRCSGIAEIPGLRGLVIPRSIPRVRPTPSRRRHAA